MPRHAWLAILPAVALAAACGTAAPSAPAAGTSHSVTPAAVAATSPPPTCKQQFDAWKTANAALVRKFDKSLKPYSSDTGSVTAGQAKALQSTAGRLEDRPLPSCADPHGYFGQAMANLVTAGVASQGGGMLSELGAMTPLENAVTLISELQAEVEKAAHQSKL